MKSMCSASIVAGLFAATAPALAGDPIVASLPWNWETRGPGCTDYEAPDDAKDLWVIEDFGIDQNTLITRFESLGTTFPDPYIVYDVTVRIYDSFPPDGKLVMSSIPGTGHYEKVGGFTIRFVADFDALLLPAGDYWLAWTVSTDSSNGKIAITWAQPGPHKVGRGQPDNAFLWNPGGGWGFENDFKKVPEDLENNGQIGANFMLFGQPQESCYADFTGDGILDLFDFLAYVNAFNAAEPEADCTGEGTLDLFDFLCFVNLFNAGC